MNRRHILSVQIDRELRTKVAEFCAMSERQLGRKVREAEVVRFLLRKGLDAQASLMDAGYVEGYRAGAAEAKAAFGRGAAALTKMHGGDGCAGRHSVVE